VSNIEMRAGGAQRTFLARFQRANGGNIVDPEVSPLATFSLPLRGATLNARIFNGGLETFMPIRASKEQQP
jgi:hypothetical protein